MGHFVVFPSPHATTSNNTLSSIMKFAKHPIYISGHSDNCEINQGEVKRARENGQEEVTDLIEKGIHPAD